jgi:hypothetical protein
LNVEKAGIIGNTPYFLHTMVIKFFEKEHAPAGLICPEVGFQHKQTDNTDDNWKNIIH